MDAGQSSTPLSPPASRGLSTGVKVAIGVIALVVLVFAAGGAAFAAFAGTVGTDHQATSTLIHKIGAENNGIETKLSAPKLDTSLLSGSNPDFDGFRKQVDDYAST